MGGLLPEVVETLVRRLMTLGAPKDAKPKLSMHVKVEQLDKLRKRDDCCTPIQISLWVLGYILLRDMFFFFVFLMFWG